jgi:hypothetical protein
MLKHALAIGAVVLLSVTSSMAQQTVAKQCAGDIKALCAGVEPGEGRIRACIKSRVVISRRRAKLCSLKLRRSEKRVGPTLKKFVWT